MTPPLKQRHSEILWVLLYCTLLDWINPSYLPFLSFQCPCSTRNFSNVSTFFPRDAVGLRRWSGRRVRRLPRAPWSTSACPPSQGMGSNEKWGILRWPLDFDRKTRNGGSSDFCHRCTRDFPLTFVEKSGLNMIWPRIMVDFCSAGFTTFQWVIQYRLIENLYQFHTCL